jgi:AraC family transcriptional regulator, positive regulator of tynA and feaB
MVISYSTREIHPRDQINYWVEVATKAFVRHEFVSLNGPSYRGDIRAGVIGDLVVSEFACDPCEVSRSASDVARGDSDDMLLCMQISGRCYFDQEGRQAVNRSGGFLMLDTRRPFSIVLPECTRTLAIKIPRRGLEARLGNLGALTARGIPAEGALAGLASGFLSTLVGRLDTIGESSASAIAGQALDLLALAVSHELNGGETSLSSVRSATLLRLKSVIEAHLREPDLKPARVAAEVGISVRYANALLAEEGTSVERYIQERRLERCRQALEDPAQMHRMIGEIAFSWGFSDLSHFGRRFRAAYAMTPGDCRRSAQDAAT